jgi:CPA2 family monovalent cation:H+ antiporter-2
MHGITFLQDLAVVMIVAGLVTLIFRRLRQPVVLGYIVAGFIIGPHTPPFPLIQDEETIKILADLGVVFLMFSLGLEFHFRKLRAVGPSALVVAAFEIMFMIWIGIQLGTLLGWPMTDRVFLGVMLALTSTMIVVKSLRDSGQIREKHGQLISGISIFDDIFVIFVMILLPGFVRSGHLPAGEIAGNLLRLFFFLVAAVVVGLLVVPRLLRYASRFGSEEMLLIVTLGLCFGVALLTVKIGYSAALGAFLVGAMVAESRELGHVVRLTEPLRDMFCAVFFVAIGMLIDPHHIIGNALPVIVITLVYLAAKVFACAAGAVIAGYDPKTAFRVGTGMAQIGEFAFILATLGLTLGLTQSRLYPIIVAVAAINALLRPYLVGNADVLAAAVARLLPEPIKTVLRVYSRWVGQLGIQRARSAGFRAVRNLGFQLALHAALIGGAFIAAAFLASRWPARLPAVPGWFGGADTACWLAAALMTLPVFHVMVRKMQAMAMLLAELAAAGAAPGPRKALLEGFLARTLWIVQLVGLALYTLLLSLTLLPPLPILAVLLVILAVLVALFGRAFNVWYARVKFSLVEIWNQPPPAVPASTPPLPPLLQEAEMELMTIRPGSAAAGKLIGELQLRTLTGASVVALERGDRRRINPGPDEELQAADRLLLLGTRAQIEAARELLEGVVGAG